MNKLVRLMALGVFGGGLALGGAAACSEQVDDSYTAASYEDTNYEDCDTEDQVNREDDCGYWFYNGMYYLGRKPGQSGIWYYWSWVTPGKTSYAPAGWNPPHGLKAPAASAATKQRYKDYQKTLPKNQKPADSVKNGNQPKPAGGNQSVPKTNNNPPKAKTNSGGGFSGGTRRR